MSRTLPIILVLLLAVGVFLADPVRRAGAMIDPERLPPADIALPVTDEHWQRMPGSEGLPRAYPPHNAISEQTLGYVNRATGSMAFVRVVAAQDRRDLLAFDPVHAMRSGGWEPAGSEEAGGLWRTRHSSTADFITEHIELETAYVVPGAWGAQPATVDRAPSAGPGWPGPGAIVQVLLTAPEESGAGTLRDHVRALAERLASELPGADAP